MLSNCVFLISMFVVCFCLADICKILTKDDVIGQMAGFLRKRKRKQILDSSSDQESNENDADDDDEQTSTHFKSISLLFLKFQFYKMINHRLRFICHLVQVMKSKWQSPTYHSHLRIRKFGVTCRLPSTARKAIQKV